MSAIEFPSSPVDGQIFVFGKKAWKWDATKGAWAAYRAVETAASVQMLDGDNGIPNEYHLVIDGSLWLTTGAPVITPIRLSRNGLYNGYPYWETDSGDYAGTYVRWRPAEFGSPDRWTVSIAGGFAGKTAESTAATPDGLAFSASGLGSGSGTLAVEPLLAAYVGQECRCGDDPYIWYKWNGTTWEGDPSSVFHEPAVTGLTGGTEHDLDGIATASLELGALIAVDLDSAQSMIYRLIESTASPSDPGLIRGYDYDAGTNPRAWKLMGLRAANLELFQSLKITSAFTGEVLAEDLTEDRVYNLGDMPGTLTVTSVSTSPLASAPAMAGAMVIDTALSLGYLSTGLSSAEDWKAITTGIVYSQTITGIDGETASDLDSLDTAGIPTGRIQWVLTGGTTWTPYKLVSSAAAEDLPFFVRPYDFALSTNEKVWVALSVKAYAVTAAFLTVYSDPQGTWSANFKATNLSDDRDYEFPDVSGGVNVVTSGSGAPGSTPVAVGLTYVDTTAEVIYNSVGTSSSADWIPVATVNGELIGYNQDQTKYQKIVIRGAAGSEYTEISDL